MRSTNELLEILRSKVVKEINMKGIRFSSVIQDLYDLTSLYTNDPYFAFGNDEAQQLFTFLRTNGYKRKSPSLNNDLNFIDICLAKYQEKSNC